MNRRLMLQSRTVFQNYHNIGNHLLNRNGQYLNLYTPSYVPGPSKGAPVQGHAWYRPTPSVHSFTDRFAEIQNGR